MRIATSRIRGETQKCNEENADLWNEFETLLRLNDTRRLEFVWHATKSHINWQVTTTLNKGGNDAADALASAAAAHHAAPQTLTDAAHERQRTALITHSFASELLFRRRTASLALHEADHGSLTDCAVVRDIPSTALSVHTEMPFCFHRQQCCKALLQRLASLNPKKTLPAVQYQRRHFSDLSCLHRSQPSSFSSSACRSRHWLS